MRETHALMHKTFAFCAALCGALSFAGCGSGSSNSNASDPQATTANDVASAAPSPTAYHRRRHYRHRGHPYATNADTTTVAAGAVPSAAGKYLCDDNQFLTYQAQFANGTLQGDREVDVCGIVTKVLAERDTRSGLHGYYDVQLAPGTTIEIVSDLGEMNAPAWPWVKVGDYSFVQGRYYYDDATSQGIDWTHHGTSRSWPTAGYVVVNGTQYY